MLAFWLAFTTRGRLRWRDPLLWTLYPLVYLAYALVRGEAEGLYAYPFIDVAVQSWAAVAASAGVIAAGFVFVGAGMVWIDRRLSWRSFRPAS